MSKNAIDEAHALLRANPRGELRFDERLAPLKFIIAPDGRLIANVEREMLEAYDAVLFVPEYRDGALELQVCLEAIEKHGDDAHLIDRWMIHYGEAGNAKWARLSIEGARFDGIVIDGEDLMRPNPLASSEAALCRFVNEHHLDALRAVVARCTNVHVESPVMVGVDPGGLDVRARFGIIRLVFTNPISTAHAAREAISKLLTHAMAEPEDEEVQA
jgi:hypothetical protein